LTLIAIGLESGLDGYLELPLDQILRGECVQMMRMLPSASVDCVFADPPYNLQLRGELRRPDDSLVDGVDDDWDRFADFPSYDTFTQEWLTECRRLLRGMQLQPVLVAQPLRPGA